MKRFPFRHPLLLLVTFILLFGVGFVIRSWFKDQQIDYYEDIWMFVGYQSDTNEIIARNVGRPSLILVQENWISGYDGCRHFLGIRIAGQDNFNFERIGQNTINCTNSSKVASEEFLANLQLVTDFSIEADLLTFFNTNGNLVFERQSSVRDYELERTHWRMLWIGTPTEVIVSNYFVSTNRYSMGDSTLKFIHHTMTGYLGCNSSWGRYWFNNNGWISISELGHTLLLCNSIHQEEALVDLLPQIRRFSIHNNLLVLEADEAAIVLVAID